MQIRRQISNTFRATSFTNTTLFFILKISYESQRCRLSRKSCRGKLWRDLRAYRPKSAARDFIEKSDFLQTPSTKFCTLHCAHLQLGSLKSTCFQLQLYVNIDNCSYWTLAKFTFVSVGTRYTCMKLF